jgi:hypothetical protein
VTYEKHWEFELPVSYDPPKVKNINLPKNPIDYFILKKQEELGMSPNPEADPESLLRRVSFELTGLPPNLEMMDSFLVDKNEDAYEVLVDKLLDLPAYGERMAVLWLDVAQYAD